jgi:hypothetical protein
MKRILWIVAGVVLAGLLAGCVFGRRLWGPSSQALPEPSSTVPTQASSAAGTKTYVNTEYGLELQYPSDWTVRENSFGSPNSKFNVELVPPKQRDLNDSILINIVLPAFAERAFLGVGASTSIASVDRVAGVKYEYEFEGLPEVGIVVPLGQDRMIIGTEKRDEDVFNEVLASFKFVR